MSYCARWLCTTNTFRWTVLTSALPVMCHMGQLHSISCSLICAVVGAPDFLSAPHLPILKSLHLFQINEHFKFKLFFTDKSTNNLHIGLSHLISVKTVWTLTLCLFLCLTTSPLFLPVYVQSSSLYFNLSHTISSMSSLTSFSLSPLLLLFIRPLQILSTTDCFYPTLWIKLQLLFRFFCSTVISALVLFTN